MRLFKKKTAARTYDRENKKPVIKASICNGEQVVGFKDLHTGKMEEVMLIKSPADLARFRAMYGIGTEEEITKEYSYYEKYLTFHITENIMACDAEYHTLKEYSDRHQQTITETMKTGVDLLYKTRK